MPFTTPERRALVDPLLDPLIEKLRVEGNNGDVTYVIYKILVRLFYGSFDRLGDALKVITSAGLQFWNDKMCPYEDEKRRLNGDIL